MDKECSPSYLIPGRMEGSACAEVPLRCLPPDSPQGDGELSGARDPRRTGLARGPSGVVPGLDCPYSQGMPYVVRVNPARHFHRGRRPQGRVGLFAGALSGTWVPNGYCGLGGTGISCPVGLTSGEV